MTTSRVIPPANGAPDRQDGGAGRGRAAGAVAAATPGLALLIGGMIAQPRPTGADVPAGTAAHLAEASTTTDYRWNFAQYPSR